MTYSEFLAGDYRRKIRGGYYITNKGRIYSEKSGKFLKVNNKGHVYYYEGGEVKQFTVWVELVRAFPDVRVPNNLKCRTNRVRGAYPWKHPNSKKKWRSAIKYKNEYKTLGYYHSKQEAQDAYYFAYLMIRGHKPW